MSLEMLLPAESKGHGDIVGMVLANKNAMVASLGKDLTVPLSTDRDAAPGIQSRLVHCIGGQDLRGWHGDRKETAEGGVEGRKDCNGRLSEFLGSMVNSSASDQINVNMSVWAQMHNGIECSREHVHVFTWKSKTMEGGGVDAEGIEIEL